MRNRNFCCLSFVLVIIVVIIINYFFLKTSNLVNHYNVLNKKLEVSMRYNFQTKRIANFYSYSNIVAVNKYSTIFQEDWTRVVGPCISCFYFYLGEVHTNIIWWTAIWYKWYLQNMAIVFCTPIKGWNWYHNCHSNIY